MDRSSECNGGLVTTAVSSLSEVPGIERERMRRGPFSAEIHSKFFSQIAALREIETGGAGNRRFGEESLRVVAWNVERLAHLDPITDTLKRLRPAVTLLSEVDKGMARSGNSHRVRELAARLQHVYAYGVEFVELDLGDPVERSLHAGEQNLLGFHGNALTAASEFHRPFLIRIEQKGGWFGSERNEPRVGGRMAIGAQIIIANQHVTMVCVHLESHSDPAERARQTACVLESIDRYDRTAPVLIGGDFNTSTFDRERDGREHRALATAADPRRLVEVQSYEPLFAVMADHGYDWTHCNDLAKATQQPHAKGTAGFPAKIDWFFTRDLRASRPLVIPAPCPEGSPSSDHDCIGVDVTPVI